MKVIELLSDSSKWCKGGIGRDKNGRSCEMSQAVSFCLSGAIARVTRSSPEVESNLVDFNNIRNKVFASIEKLYPSFKESRGFKNLSMAAFNDDPEITYEDIVKILKDADV